MGSEMCIRDRIVVAALARPDRDALLLQQIEQHWPVEFPTQGQAKEVAVAVLRITLVGEQPPHIHIGALGQRRPDHLIAEACDPHGVGAGEGQHRPKGTLLRSSWLKQQGFLVQEL